MDIERRVAAEFRIEGRRLEGHAAVFNTRVSIADFTEQVAPGAFGDSLRSGADVLALVDHDTGRLLGRTKAGTLKLSEDSRGLAFSIEMPDTQLGHDMLALAARGDLGGASFGFRVPKGGDKWEGRNRTLTRVDLFDVSVVQSFPAYPQTSVSARHRAGKFMPLDVAKRYLELIA